MRIHTIVFNKDRIKKKKKMKYIQQIESKYSNSEVDSVIFYTM